jgi:hypothetical protein
MDFYLMKYRNQNTCMNEFLYDLNLLEYIDTTVKILKLTLLFNT